MRNSPEQRIAARPRRLCDIGEPIADIESLMPRFTNDGAWAAEIPVVDKTVLRPGHVRWCTDRLPEPYRGMLILHDCHGLTLDRIASILGETLAEARSFVHRARMALATLLATADQQGDRCDIGSER